MLIIFYWSSYSKDFLKIREWWFGFRQLCFNCLFLVFKLKLININYIWFGTYFFQGFSLQKINNSSKCCMMLWNYNIYSFKKINNWDYHFWLRLLSKNIRIGKKVRMKPYFCFFLRCNSNHWTLDLKATIIVWKLLKSF